VKNKRKNELDHAKRRAYERFGLILNHASMKEIVRMIKEGKSTAVKKESNRVVLHILEYQGKKIKVAYDKNRGCLITVLRANGDEYGME